MAVIGVKSITGITSITNAAGGADVLTFHSNNTTERVRIKSDGKIGINSTSPTYGMHLHGTTASNNAYYYAEQSSAGASAGFRLKTTGSHFAMYGATNGSALGIYDYNAGAERFTIDSTGEVGIGTFAPQYELHVWPSGATSSGQICAQSNGANTFAELVLKCTDGGNANIWRNSSGKTDYGGANSLNIYQSANANIAFFTNGNNQRLLITGTGNVGINSTIPRSKLHAANGSSNYNPGNPTGLGAGAVACLESSGDVALQFLSSTTTDNFIYFGDTSQATTGSIQYDHNVNALLFNVNGGTERFRIRSGGKVNITPGGALSGNHPPGDLNIVGTNFLTMTPNDNSNASDNEVLGQISFLPYAAGNVASASAKIEAVAEPGQSGSANPTSLKFYTKPSGVGPGSSGTERLRLTGGGQLIQYTTHTTGNSFHQNTNWYGDDASQYTIEVRDFNEMYATKTTNSNSYQQIIYKREKMTHNCDIEFMLAGDSDQAGSNWYHLGMTICGDGSDTMSNFDTLIFRCHGNTASSNHIRVDKGGGGTAFTSQGTHIPQFFDGNDRHIQIKIRGRRYSVYSDGVELMTQYSDADNPRQNGFFGFAIYEASTVNPWLKIRDFKLQNYSLNTSLPSWDVIKSVPASTNNAYHYTVTGLNNPRTVEIRFWRLRHSGATGRMLMRLGPSSGYITSGYYDIGTWRSDSDGGATITRGHNQGQWWPLNYDFNNPTNYYSGCITLRRISNSGRNTRIIYESTVTVDYDSGTTQYFINNTGQMTFANNNAWDRLTFYNESSSAVLNYGELEILAQH